MGDIKNTAIPYAGYYYQTLYGVKFLLEWLANPNIYSQVAFEADTSDESIPAAIDDIVCKREDGTFEYYQVKFTSDASKHELSWEWLFKKSKKGRSLVKKLFDGLKEIDLSRLHSAELVTNRVPSEEFSRSLSKNFLNFDKLNKETRALFVDELESEENVRLLFSHMSFMHSQKNILQLRIEILSKAYNLRTSDDIYRLIDEAIVWSTHKNRPNEDGWIFTSDIKNIFSGAKPKPLPQNFSIPHGYAPPCQKFHEKLMKSIVNRSNTINVVTGPPGRGKSTYLSYLTTELDKESIPYIRHHYFLSIADKTANRFSHFKVQSDFQHQLKFYHGIEKKTFQKSLLACASSYGCDGKPLVVLIDGLDHVWRDNKEDIKPLDSLFNELFPPIDNVIYIIGTQPIEDHKLPKKLLRLKRREEWLKLPPLTGNAILKFLKELVVQERIEIRYHESQKEESLKKSAEALLDLTSGHPLSLIYVTEQFHFSNTPISTYEIGKFPKVFGEHIHDYYSELWRTISYPQKHALHIISSFNFGWNKVEINALLSNELSEDYLSGVQHLLYWTRTGFKPFHESIIAFVKSLPEHQDIINRYLPQLSELIDDISSDYKRNIWSHKLKLAQGKFLNSQKRLNRNWIIKRLSEGYFSQDLEDILEKMSFELMRNGFIADAHNYRTLKTRLINSSQNINELDKLIELTLKIAPSSVIDEHIASSEQLLPGELARLSICLNFRNNKTDAEDISKQAIDSYNARNLLRTRYNDSASEVGNIFRSQILLGQDVSDNLQKFGKQYSSTIIKSCIEVGDIEAIRKYRPLFKNINDRKKSEYASIRLAISEGINIVEIANFAELGETEFIKFVRTAQNEVSNEGLASSIDCPANRTSIKSNNGSYSEEFFHTLNTLYALAGPCSWLDCQLNLNPDFTNKDTSPTQIFEVMLETAMYVFDCLEHEYQLSLTNILEIAENVIFDHSGHWQQSSIDDFLHDLVRVAVDCQLLFGKRDIGTDEIDFIIKSDQFNFIRFVYWYSELSLELISRDAAITIFDGVSDELNSLDIQERVSLLIAATQIALTHDEKSRADSFIIKAWALTVGYNSYKDDSINELISSIKYLSTIDSQAAIDNLQKLVPFIVNFSSLTTEGNNPNEEINELLAKYSVNTLSQKYMFELLQGEAYSANNTLNNLLEHSDLLSPIYENICKTGLLNENLRSLELRANKGCTRAFCLINIALEHNGSLKIQANKDHYSNSEVEKDKLSESDFELYPPDKFKYFVEHFKSKYLYEEHYKAWFDYWVEQGQHGLLLKNIVPEVLKNELIESRYLVDSVFELSLKHVGKKNSFDLLIEAHNQNEGWRAYYTTEKVFHRLDKVADIYPRRVDEFIKRTTYEIEGDSGFKLPYHKYTYLLCKLGCKKDAINFVNSLVDDAVNEVEILNPMTPSWDWGTSCSDNIAIDILISRLMIPIASTKWFVAQQLVELLLSKQYYSIVQSKLLAALSKCKVELECIEIISIFYFASCKGGVPPLKIAELINARSICSDLMLLNMGLEPSVGNYAFDAKTFEFYTKASMRRIFNSSNGTDFPPVYMNTLEDLQTQSVSPFPLPFTEVMLSEWCRMQKTAEHFDSYLSYYLNSEGYNRDMTAMVYPSKGLRARSAYLRALEFAKVNFNLPEQWHVFEANIAFPFDSCLFQLKPEKLIELDRYAWSIEQAELTREISRCALDINNEIEGQVLGAISFPMSIDENSFLEVDIYRVEGGLEHNNFEEVLPWIWRCSESIFDYSKDIYSQTEQGPDFNFLVSRSYPLKHYGHWHSEIESRGYFSPVPLDKETKLVLKNVDNSIEYSIGNNRIGTFKFANCNWQPSYYKDGKPNTITKLMLDSKNRKYWQSEYGKPESLLCIIKLFQRDDSYKDFEETRIVHTVSV